MFLFPRCLAVTSRVARILLGVTVALSLVLLSVAPSFAVGGVTGSLNGTVLNDAKEPVVGAEVSVSAPSGTFKARTNARGFFSIIGVASDTYTVSVSVPGYQTITIPASR